MSRFPRRDWIYATSAQLRYLRMLLNRCHSMLVDSYYIRDWDRILRSEASNMIQVLKSRIAAKEAERAAVPVITPERAAELTHEGEQDALAYRKQVKQMWNLDTKKSPPR